MKKLFGVKGKKKELKVKDVVSHNALMCEKGQEV